MRARRGGNVRADLTARHLDWCHARNLRPSTIYQRHRALVRLSLAIGCAPALATPEALADWWDGLTARLTPAGRKADLLHVRGFYRWAVLEEHLVTDPTLRLASPRLPRRLPRPIPDADLAVALEMAPERVRPWLYLAAYAGLRACEIAQVRGEDVAWDHEPPVLLIPEGKGGGMSAVPIPPVLAEVLAGLPRRGWLFPRGDGLPGANRPWTISQVANRYLHGLGITHTLHTLRHWYGTSVYRESGHDLRATQELMRHLSPVSTAGYTWVSPGDAAATVARLPVLV